MTDYKLTLRSALGKIYIEILPRNDVAPYLKVFYSVGRGVLEDIQQVIEQ